MKTIQRIISLFFFWRLALLIPLLIGFIFLFYRQGYEYTNIWKFIAPYFPVSNFLLYPWANFDGVHYLRIAGDGYTNNGGFFPLYPFLIHLFSLLFGNGKTFGDTQFFTGLFLSNIFFLLSLIVFYFLVRLDYPQKIAVLSIIFLLLFPTSFFFVSIYTESLFLLLSLLCFFHARRKEWLQAGILGMLLSATRVVGIFIFPVLLYEFFIQEKLSKINNKRNYVQSLIKIFPLFLTPLGLFSYMWFNLQKWGDAFYFVKAQGMLSNNRSVDAIVFFPQTVYRYFKMLITIPYSQYEFWIALLELLVFFFTAILLYIAWKKGVRLSYILFSLFCFFVPISTGTFTALPRYVVVLFPIFISLALINNNKIQIIYSIISSILLFILLLLFSRGYFVA